jgi:hypothetical protein
VLRLYEPVVLSLQLTTTLIDEVGVTAKTKSAAFTSCQRYGDKRQKIYPSYGTLINAHAITNGHKKSISTDHRYRTSEE